MTTAGGGRQYEARALVGVAPNPSGSAVRAFAPFRLSTYRALDRNPQTSARYVAWLERMVSEVIAARGGDTSRIEWHTASHEELIEDGVVI